MASSRAADCIWPPAIGENPTFKVARYAPLRLTRNNRAFTRLGHIPLSSNGKTTDSDSVN